MKKRRRARELALQGLYALEVSGNVLATVLEEVADRGQNDPDLVVFAGDLIRQSFSHREMLDGSVASIVENWEFKRVALLDRLILRMALCELLYFDEIPPKVTINEAIELAKAFSTEQSGRFVNGILDALYHGLKHDDKIVKRGRGLIG